MLNTIYNDVKKLLASTDAAHGIDHIDRVVELSLAFADKMGIEDTRIIHLIALLHDVDDYKLFGAESCGLANALIIMERVDIHPSIRDRVIKGISEIGFNKRLQGVQPTTVESMIVSDADMCDAMGINGVIRGIQYSQSKGWSFFDENIAPRKDLTYEQYVNYPPEVTMCYLFEKPLRLMSMIMTSPGHTEAYKRQMHMIQFMRDYFKENNLPEWEARLKEYLGV